MKRIIISLSAILGLSLGAAAQMPDEIYGDSDPNVKLEVITSDEPVKETKQEIKEREKKLRELNDDVAYAKAANSIRRGYFVLVADNLEVGRNGYRHCGINSNANFILCQGTDAVVQYAYKMYDPGANGLGGWTGKGTIRNKRVTYDDNGDVHVQFAIRGSSCDAEVFITLYHNNNRAVAQVVHGGSVTYYGNILPYRDKEHR